MYQSKFYPNYISDKSYINIPCQTSSHKFFVTLKIIESVLYKCIFSCFEIKICKFFSRPEYEEQYFEILTRSRFDLKALLEPC